MHATTFDYLQPTAEQIETMKQARDAARIYADALERLLPEGPDKTFTMRSLRTVAMWANISITRHADGSPRDADRPPRMGPSDESRLERT